MLKALQKLCNASFAILFMALGLLAVTMGCGGGNQSGTATQSVVVNMATDPELDDKLFVMTINNKSSLSLSTISYQTVSSISTTVTDPITHEPTTTTVTGAPVPHTVTLIPPVRPGSSVAGTFIYDSDLGKNRFFSMTVSDERGAVPQAFTVRIFPDGSADPADGVFNYTAGVGGSATTTTTK